MLIKIYAICFLNIATFFDVKDLIVKFYYCKSVFEHTNLIILDIIRSPEDELARLFHCPAKRDSTYSSMSETSSSSTYDLSGSSQRLTSSGRETSTANTSPVTNMTTPETPSTASQSPDFTPGNNIMVVVSGTGDNSGVNTQQQGESPTFSSTSTATVSDQSTSSVSTTDTNNSAQPQNNNQRAAAAALAAEAVAAANQRQSNHYNTIANSNIRQPFFTFALKYEEDNNLVRIDFIVSFLLSL